MRGRRECRGAGYSGAEWLLKVRESRLYVQEWRLHANNTKSDSRETQRGLCLWFSSALNDLQGGVPSREGIRHSIEERPRRRFYVPRASQGFPQIWMGSAPSGRHRPLRAKDPMFAAIKTEQVQFQWKHWSANPPRNSHTAIYSINILSKYSSLISHRPSMFEGRHIDYRSSKVDTSITDLRRSTHRSSKVNTSISEGRHVTSIFESRHIYLSSKVDASKIEGGNITPTIRRRILSTTALLYKFLE